MILYLDPKMKLYSLWGPSQFSTIEGQNEFLNGDTFWDGNVDLDLFFLLGHCNGTWSPFRVLYLFHILRNEDVWDSNVDFLNTNILDPGFTQREP